MFNGSGQVGNVLVIAASTSDTTPEDAFKIKKLEVACVPAPPPPPPCVQGEFVADRQHVDLGHDRQHPHVHDQRRVGEGQRVQPHRQQRHVERRASSAPTRAASASPTAAKAPAPTTPTRWTTSAGGHNYVLFEFSQAVTVTQAFLDYIGADSDISVWIGSKIDPYNNHLTLSDALLAA